ncbi:methyltransferase domain-containing protein [Streptomyces sp. NPDC018019]|uniref:methyltransferase domain-containing protein n=1 Tax=Streptomyces sp. NPDC018019 TaxID=3365030 RepID=UPI0037B3C4F4
MNDAVSTVQEAAELREQVAAQLDQRGYFEGQSWLRDAFMAVPREHFVPDRVWWPVAKDGLYPLMDRTTRPRQWLKAVYRTQQMLITQIDDGAIQPEEGPVTTDAFTDFTSSISCSAVVVEMLHHLDPQPGETVLEIGTGTGYNTALLAHRVGAGNVTSIEIDPQIAEWARERLSLLGIGARLVVGDGEKGYADSAPYDGILSTAAVREVPRAWPAQVRAGGVIVTPVATPFNWDGGTYDGLCRLVCDGEGSAVGRMVSGVAFMKVRGQRSQRPFEELGWPALGDYQVSVSAEAGQRVRTGP